MPRRRCHLGVGGLLGFIAESAFETGSGVQGDDLIIFEVNGWHNVVHIASGLFLLALLRRHDTARLAALSFGAIYGIVTIIGLIDGKDVLGLFPVNAADNVLHIVLTVAAFAAGLRRYAIGHAPARHGPRKEETMSPREARRRAGCARSAEGRPRRFKV